MQNLHIPVTCILPDRVQLAISNYIVNYIAIFYKSPPHRPISHCYAGHYKIQHYRKHCRKLYRKLYHEHAVKQSFDSTISSTILITTPPLTSPLSYEITVLDNKTLA